MYRLTFLLLAWGLRHNRSHSLRHNHLHKFAALTPICTMRGLSIPATPTYLKTLSSISRLRASWMTIFLLPSMSGQNAEACGCFAGSRLNVKSTSALVK